MKTEKYFFVITYVLEPINAEIIDKEKRYITSYGLIEIEDKEKDSSSEKFEMISENCKKEWNETHDGANQWSKFKRGVIFYYCKAD